MTNFSQNIAKLTAVATIAATLSMPISAFAVESDATLPETIGPWQVSTLARDSANTRIEAYKVDKNLVAWTEVSVGTRNLYVYDGTAVRILASFDKSDWKDDGNYFYDAVTGNFDVADGKVVWTMSDGYDREIFAYNGDAVAKVSDNSYDDRHPITSEGRVAWTSQPSASAYNLMVRDQFGIRRVDAWPVTNYAFSGFNLYWMNVRPNEGMLVFANTGLVNSTVGQGDDRQMAQYFITDGQGNAAWEYSTKIWSNDKRVTYVSVNGGRAIQVIQRDVPATVTRIEDTNNGNVAMSLSEPYLKNTVTSEFVGAWLQRPLVSYQSRTKLRYMDNGYAYNRESGFNNLLVVNAGTEEIHSNDFIVQDRLEADGSAAAAARVAGGLATFVDGKFVVIPSTVKAESLAVKNGNIAWIEGTDGQQTLKFATTAVIVKSGQNAVALSGHLVKASNSPAVYFAARDGKRYVFTGESLFKSWFSDFSTVTVVSPAKLAAMPLGGNVIYKPGSTLLKTASSSTVYSVNENGQLNSIKNESAAVAMYGTNWKSLITVVPETELAGYLMGGALDTYYVYGR